MPDADNFPNDAGAGPRLIAMAVCAGFLTLVSAISAATELPGALVSMRPHLAASLVLVFGMFATLTLSARLATLSLAALALSLLWSLGVLALTRLTLTEAPLVAVLLQTGTGMLFLALVLHLYAAETARGMNERDAAHKAAAYFLNPALCAFLALQAGLTALLPDGAPVMLGGITAAFSMGLVVFWVVPILLERMRMSETLVVRTNRLREIRERIAGPLAFVAVPRWAFAWLGAGAIVFAIFIFDAGRWQPGQASLLPLLWKLGGSPFGLVFLVVGGLGTLAARDARAFVACCAAPFLCASLGAWVATEEALAPPETIARLMVLGAAAGAAPCYAMLASLSVFRRFGDDMQTAYVRALNEAGLAVFCVTLCILACLGVFAVHFAGGGAALVILTFEIFAPFLVLPALMLVMENLFPRRRSVEQLYGAGKPQTQEQP